jgi:hypothetical protein
MGILTDTDQSVQRSCAGSGRKAFVASIYRDGQG